MVLMQTAVTEIKNPKHSHSEKTRFLLDCGSQRTYITKSLADTMGLKREQEQEIRLSTFGSENAKVIKTASTSNVDNLIPRKPDLEDFWSVEDVGITENSLKSEDETAKEEFKETIKHEDGRYNVTWPWKEEMPDLPINRGLALGRLKSCVKRLRNNGELLKRHNSVIDEQLNNGVIEKVQDPASSNLKHYLPHHAVLNPLKTTTKLRVVYDASAKTRSTDNSLNERLLRGPVMLHNLCGLLMRFRLHKVALVADIEKAFLQIGLQPSQIDVTRSLWLKDYEVPSVSQSNIQEYRICRVPFGVISSPFLLGATVEHHLEQCNTATALRLKDDIYVDSLITGTDSEAEAIQLYQCSNTIFQDASLNLREWLSNSNSVNHLISERDRAISETMTVLAYEWNSTADVMSMKSPTKMNMGSKHITKRNILKVVASAFDPLGLITPVLLRGKFLLQTIWSKHFEWDDQIEDGDILETWSSIAADLENTDHIEVQRNISMDVKSGDATYKQVCVCAASTRAYAASVYLLQTINGVSKIDLVFAKSRLAPLKGMTVPRLESMAVLIGVRCLQFVKGQLKLDIVKTHLWTDSQCVLGWLTTKRKLDVFVRNMVMEIKGHDIVFDYVNRKENPADVATRDTSVHDMCDNQLWWHGPRWLQALDEREPNLPEADNELNYECKEESETANIVEEIAANLLPLVASWTLHYLSTEDTGLSEPFQLHSGS